MAQTPENNELIKIQ